MAVTRAMFLPYGEDGTSEEDLGIFLAGWREYQAWAVWEEPVVHHARLFPLIARLDEHLAVLRRYAAMPMDVFLADDRNAETSQFRLLLAFVATIDSISGWRGRCERGSVPAPSPTPWRTGPTGTRRCGVSSAPR